MKHLWNNIKTEASGWQKLKTLILWKLVSLFLNLQGSTSQTELNKEKQGYLQTFIWYHSSRNTQTYPTQASGPADLMLSDMTFTSCPAPWKAPGVLSYSLRLSLCYLPPPRCLFGALSALVWYWLSLAIHRQHIGTAASQHRGAAKHD